jgi:hypothetical protein
MKSFEQFIKEEITIKGNVGVPGEEDRNEPSYLSGVEREAGERVGRQHPQEIGGRMMQIVGENKSLTRGKDKELEELAEQIIKDIYSGILDNVDLDIKLVKDGMEVKEFMDDEKEKQKERKEKKKEQQEEQQEEQEPNRKSTSRELKLEVDKRKLANAITQGEAKNTKLIIQMAECKDGLKRILGDRNGETLHRNLIELSELADKMDWIIPVQMKADMMERNPQGMAGACSCEWPEAEEDEETKSAAENVLDELQNKEEGDISDMAEELGELFSNGKPVIRSRGIDFVMLLHETVKGIYQLITSAGIPEDEELAKNVLMNTDTFADEAEDFKYGPKIAGDLRDFINANPKSSQFENVREYVFGKMMLIPAEDFLKLMKGILMKTPDARREIDSLVDEVIEELEGYEKEVSDLDMKRRFEQPEAETPEGTIEGEEESDIDNLIKQSVDREEDYSNKTPREINDLIDDALDNGDFERVKMLSQYLKEGKEIYLREIERINESNLKHNRK